jgi:RimJ/RimL family protein N-acetyltransferase
MRTVFERVGWTHVGTLITHDRDWANYRITRAQWALRPKSARA